MLPCIGGASASLLARSGSWSARGGRTRCRRMRFPPKVSQRRMAAQRRGVWTSLIPPPSPRRALRCSRQALVVSKLSGHRSPAAPGAVAADRQVVSAPTLMAIRSWPWWPAGSGVCAAGVSAGGCVAGYGPGRGPSLPRRRRPGPRPHDADQHHRAERGGHHRRHRRRDQRLTST
jgi:hypothetical protein